MSVTTGPDKIKPIRGNRGSRCDYESIRIMKNHAGLEEVDVEQVRGRRDPGLGLARPKAAKNRATCWLKTAVM